MCDVSRSSKTERILKTVIDGEHISALRQTLSLAWSRYFHSHNNLWFTMSIVHTSQQHVPCQFQFKVGMQSCFGGHFFYFMQARASNSLSGGRAYIAEIYSIVQCSAGLAAD